MILTRPPMGWNSWNTFASDIDETMIMETADAMVNEGLLDLGYEYLVIDDCWSEKVRDAKGHLVPDHNKFPHGMKYVADYVHSTGLKFGMYSCAGAVTCAGYPGSFEHEFIDAASFASWGVDYLKYDYCFRDPNVPGEILYRRMGLALATCGRDIVFSACNWGADESQNWIKTTGAHLWRSTQDIFDTWGSIKTLTQKQLDLFKTNGQGCFNDMDMLVVGLNGRGNVAMKDSLLSFEEYKAHFSIWALFGSPLMLGCDVRSMTDETKQIIKNREVIDIARDEAARQPFVIHAGFPSDEALTVCRMLENGDIAVGFINLSDKPVGRWRFFLTPGHIGLDASCGKNLHLRDVWTGEEFDMENEIFVAEEPLPPHSVRLYRVSLIDC